MSLQEKEKLEELKMTAEARAVIEKELVLDGLPEKERWLKIHEHAKELSTVIAKSLQDLILPNINIQPPVDKLANIVQQLQRRLRKNLEIFTKVLPSSLESFKSHSGMIHHIALLENLLSYLLKPGEFLVRYGWESFLQIITQDLSYVEESKNLDKDSLMPLYQKIKAMAEKNSLHLKDGASPICVQINNELLATIKYEFMVKEGRKKYEKNLPDIKHLKRSATDKVAELDKILARFNPKHRKHKKDFDHEEMHFISRAWKYFLTKVLIHENAMLFKLKDFYISYFSCISSYLDLCKLKKEFLSKDKFFRDHLNGKISENLQFLEGNLAALKIIICQNYIDINGEKYEKLREWIACIEEEFVFFQKIKAPERKEMKKNPTEIFHETINNLYEGVRLEGSFEDLDKESQNNKLKKLFIMLVNILGSIKDKLDKGELEYQPVCRDSLFKLEEEVRVVLECLSGAIKDKIAQKFCRELFSGMGNYIHCLVYNKLGIMSRERGIDENFNTIKIAKGMQGFFLRDASHIFDLVAIKKFFVLVGKEQEKTIWPEAVPEKEGVGPPKPPVIVPDVKALAADPRNSLIVSSTLASVTEFINLDPRKFPLEKEIERKNTKEIEHEKEQLLEKEKLYLQSAEALGMSVTDVKLSHFIISYNICLAEIKLKNFEEAKKRLYDLIQIAEKNPGLIISAWWPIQSQYLLGYCYYQHKAKKAEAIAIVPVDNAISCLQRALLSAKSLAGQPLSTSGDFLDICYFLEQAVTYSCDYRDFAASAALKKETKSLRSDPKVKRAHYSSKSQNMPCTPAAGIPQPALQVNIASLEPISLDPRIYGGHAWNWHFLTDGARHEKEGKLKALLTLEKSNAGPASAAAAGGGSTLYHIGLSYQIVLLHMQLNQFQQAIIRLKALVSDAGLEVCAKSDWWRIQINYLLGCCYHHSGNLQAAEAKDALEKADLCLGEAKKILCDKFLSSGKDCPGYAIEIHDYIKKAIRENLIPLSARARFSKPKERKLAVSGVEAQSRMVCIAISHLMDLVNVDPRQFGPQRPPGYIVVKTRAKKKKKANRRSLLEEQEQFLLEKEHKAEREEKKELHLQWIALSYKICLFQIKEGRLDAAIARLQTLIAAENLAYITAELWPMQLNYLLGYCYYYHFQAGEGEDHSLIEKAVHYLNSSLLALKVLEKRREPIFKAVPAILYHVDTALLIARRFLPKKEQKFIARIIPKPKIEPEVIEDPLAEAAEEKDYLRLFKAAEKDAEEQLQKTWEEIEIFLSRENSSKEIDRFQFKQGMFEKLRPAFQFMCFMKKVFPHADIFLNGGALRRILNNLPIADYDFVSNLEMDNPKVATAVAWLGLNSRLRYGLLRDPKKRMIVHILLPEPDSRLKTASPMDVRYCKIKRTQLAASLFEDSLAGDFNINKIYISPLKSPRANIHDFHHGLKDLLQGKFSLIHGRYTASSTRRNLESDLSMFKLAFLLINKDLTPTPDLTKILESPDRLAQICYPSEASIIDRQKTLLRVLDDYFRKSRDNVISTLNGMAEYKARSVEEIKADLNFASSLRKEFRRNVRKMLNQKPIINLLNIVFTQLDFPSPADQKKQDKGESGLNKPPVMKLTWFMEYFATHLTQQYVNEFYGIKSSGIRGSWVDKFLPLFVAMMINPHVSKAGTDFTACLTALRAGISTRSKWLTHCFRLERGDTVATKAQAILHGRDFCKMARLIYPSSGSAAAPQAEAAGVFSSPRDSSGLPHFSQTRAARMFTATKQASSPSVSPGALAVVSPPKTGLCPD